MIDLGIELEDRPGALAEMGEALGAAGVSVEGGGVFVAGAIGRRMAEARINIEVQYSDHDGNLVLLVDDPDRGGQVVAARGSRD